MLVTVIKGCKACLNDYHFSQENNAAIVDHIFASKTMAWPAIPIYHLRDLIKRYPFHSTNTFH